MKLLRVIASMDPATGGPCQGIRHSIPALERLGVRNEVVCLDESADGDGFPVHALGRGRGAWSYHPALAPWLRENLPRFDATIVHGLWLYPSFATWRRKARCFVMPHGMLDPWFQQARPLKALRNTLYWKLIEQRTIRDAEGVLFTCEEEMRLARQPFRPYRPKREWVVGYGIPEPAGDAEAQRAKFAACYPALREGRFVLFLGRIHPKKGVDLLLRGCAPAMTNLVIAGPCADAGYLESLKALAISLGLSVTWLPMLSGDIKWGAFHSCEALILPSHQENFGIAVAEALACGKPVLISHKVNIWREIEADGAGLVAEDTVEGVRTLLSQWLALDAGRRDAMAVAARRCYRKRFEICAAAEALFEVVRRNRSLAAG